MLQRATAQGQKQGASQCRESLARRSTREFCAASRFCGELCFTARVMTLLAPALIDGDLEGSDCFSLLRFWCVSEYLIENAASALCSNGTERCFEAEERDRSDLRSSTDEVDSHDLAPKLKSPMEAGRAL